MLQLMSIFMIFIGSFSKVGMKILAVMVLVFTFFMVICLLVYREALATQRAMEYASDSDNLDTVDLIMDYTE